MKRHVHITATEVEGVLEAAATGWDGRIFRMSRKAYFAWSAKPRLLPTTSAAYVLYADYFDKSAGKDLYVGHTENLITRGQVHNSEKDFWTAALVLTSAGDWMNSAHTKRIEHTLIGWSKNANRYRVTNGNDSAPGSLGTADELQCERFLAPLREILSMIGIDLFEPNLAGLYDYADGPRQGKTGRRCAARIVALEPNPILQIISGSELDVFSPDEEFIALVEAGAVSWDEQSKRARFLRDVEVSAIDPNDLGVFRVFGTLASKWVNQNLASLKDVLSEARRKRQNAALESAAATAAAAAPSEEGTTPVRGASGSDLEPGA